jgi:hypothetical protein
MKTLLKIAYKLGYDPHDITRLGKGELIMIGAMFILLILTFIV